MKQTIFVGIIILLLSIVSQAQDSTFDTTIIQDTIASEKLTVDSTVEAAGITDEEPIYPMSPERKENLISYSKFKNVWRFFSFFLGLIIMSLFLFTGFSAKLRDWAQIAKYRFLIFWMYLGLFALFNYIIEFPFSFYRSFMVENSYGFINQTFMEWWSEDLLTLGLTILIGIIPFWFIYWLIDIAKRWWLLFSLGSIPFLVLVMIIVPIYIMPLYNDFVPLENEQLRTELLALSDKAGIEDPDLFQVNASKQSTKLGAYVTGMFGSKRIVLYDTMIDNFEMDEIKFVTGHEMGHYVKNHIWYGLLVTILFICFALWLTDLMIHKFIDRFKAKFKFNKLSDIASLPLLMIFLAIISFVFEPVTNGFSRYNEHQSDIYGMEISEVSGESAAIAFDKLSAFNLSDPDPHPIIEFWFYSHPTLKKRMEFVRNYKP